MKYDYDELPGGWAGRTMINSDSDEVETWAYATLSNPRSNIIIKNYGVELCEVLVRKQSDFTLVKLRWS
jgi:hypothetical protein